MGKILDSPDLADTQVDDGPADDTGPVRRSCGKKILFVLLLVVGLFGVLEITLRAGNFLTTGTWDYLPVVRMAAELYEPHPYFCYALRPNAHSVGSGANIRTNRWGFRGEDVTREKPEGAVRIVCLGGSTTFSLHASDNRHTWPAQLERILNERHAPTRFEVLNFGTPGYCSIESFSIFALRGLDFDPDIVLIHDALNDVPAVFRDDVVSDYRHARRPYTRLGNRWLAKSALWRIVMLAAIRLPEQPYSGPYNLSKDGVRTFQQHVASTAALAHAYGVEPVIVTMPDALPRGDEECRRQSTEIGLARVLIESLRHLSRQQGITLVDLAATFPKDPDLFTDETHKTDEGLERAAWMIADELEQNGVIGRAIEGRPRRANGPTASGEEQSRPPH